jgi:hypothetical protein
MAAFVAVDGLRYPDGFFRSLCHDLNKDIALAERCGT